MLDGSIQVGARLQHANHRVVEIIHSKREKRRVSCSASGLVLCLNENERAGSSLQHGLMRGAADDGQLECGLEKGQCFRDVPQQHDNAAQRRHSNETNGRMECYERDATSNAHTAAAAPLKDRLGSSR